MSTDADVSLLVGEYDALIHADSQVVPGDGKVDWEELNNRLVDEAEWTDGGAEAISWLARAYGVFALRNALALAIALGIQDGEAGL